MVERNVADAPFLTPDVLRNEMKRSLFLTLLAVVLAGCATKQVVTLDLDAKTLTHNSKPITPADLIALWDSVDYGEVDFITKTEGTLEKADLKKTIDEIGLLGLTFLQVALDAPSSNLTEKAQNEVMHGIGEELAEP